MKLLYFDCSMGAAGDMLMGALYELCPDQEGFLKKLNGALAPLVQVSALPDSKRGIRATHMRVAVNGLEEEDLASGGGERHRHHHHTTVRELREKIDGLDLPSPVRENAKAVYDLIAQAESQVHGEPVEHIHFHEVGSADALADVLGVCMLLHDLAPEKILCSPVRVGSGTVRCAHGLLPVPAPATELLLRGLPIFAGDVPGEMCTPTGAALLRHFAAGFGPMPPMRVRSLGQGSGTRDFETANLLRAFWGETEETAGQVLELSCNIDDMTGEELGFAREELFRAGALDVYTTAIGMKKGRPGVILSCLCPPERREDMVRAIFKNTSTLGIRETVCRRYTLRRSSELRETEAGAVRIKRASGWDVCREKPEYEDLARIARERGVSLREAARLTEKP